MIKHAEMVYAYIYMCVCVFFSGTDYYWSIIWYGLRTRKR